MKKIIGAYKHFEGIKRYRAPEFRSDATEFHVTLWNLNYDESVIEEISPTEIPLIIQEYEGKDKALFVKEFVKDPPQFAKEFVKASRKIYKLISQNPHISAVQIAESIGLSPRQVQKYMKRLQDLDKIVRVGGRKTGEWKIIDEEYEGFFDRI